MLKLPKTSDVEEALLLFLQHRDESVTPQQVYAPLGDFFSLSRSEQQEPMPRQNERHWDNRVRTARKQLVERGLLDNSQHGVWTLTEKGRKTQTASANDIQRREREVVATVERSSARRQSGSMFSKILIANRGEIACRVIKTARRMEAAE